MLPGRGVGMARHRVTRFFPAPSSLGTRRAGADSAAAAALAAGTGSKGSAHSDGQPTARTVAAQRLAKELQASGSRLAASVTDLFKFTKETVVGIVKLSDAHLRGLESRIAVHEGRLKQSHAQGDTSGVVHNTDALRQLYMEHKTKLDDMLFFWIFGGAVCVAGWIRLAWVQASRDRARRAEDAELRLTLANVVREVVGEMLEQQAAQQAAQKEGLVQQALQQAQRVGEVAAKPAAAPATGAGAAETNPHVRMGDEPRLLIAALPVQPVDAEGLARLFRATALAAASACALSIVASCAGLMRGR